MRHRITLRTPVYSSAGDVISSYTTLATVWASVEPMLGLPMNQERVEAKRDISEQWATVRIRYRADVNTSIQLVHGSATYDIRAVADVNSMRRFLELSCRVVL